MNRPAIAVLLLLLPFLGFSAPAGANQGIEQAKRAYERGDYAAAHDRLIVSARKGDAEAQELLGFMYAFGPRLYPGVPLSPGISLQWLDRAARSGRPAARYLYCALARRERVSLPATAYCFDAIGESGEPPARYSDPMQQRR